MSKKNTLWIFISLIGLSVLAAITVPYIVAYLRQPQGLIFSGLWINNSSDINGYLPWIEQARQGRALFTILFTPEPQKALLFNPFFLLLGMFANLTGVSNILAFHIARVLISLLFLVALTVFVQRLIGGKREELLLAVALVIFFPGRGGELSSGSVTFWGMFENGFLIFSIMLFLLILFEVEGALVRGARCWILPGILAFLLAITHAYALVCLSSTIVLFLVYTAAVDRDSFARYFKVVLVAGLWTLPAALYIAFLYFTNEYLSGAVGYEPKHTLFTVFSFYHVYWLLAAAGIVKAAVEKNRRLTILACWLISSTIFYYVPPFYKKFSEGMQIPLVLLAVVGGFYLIQKGGEMLPTRGKALRPIMYILFCVSCMPLAIDYLHETGNMITARYRCLYLEEGTLKTFKWLRENAALGDVVFSDVMTSNYLPGRTGLSVVRGHRFLTYNYDKKATEAASVFSGRVPFEKLSQSYNVKYVLFVPSRMMDFVWQPSKESGLRPVFATEDGTVVYELAE